MTKSSAVAPEAHGGTNVEIPARANFFRYNKVVRMD